MEVNNTTCTESVAHLFVGIDPSIRNTGLCIIDFNQEPSVSLFDVSKLGKVSKDQIERFIDIPNLIISAIEAAIVDYNNIILHVGYEDYSYHSTHKAFTLGELGGCIKTNLVKLKDKNNINDINITMVPPTKLKKFASKDGTVPKSIMMQCFSNTIEYNIDNEVKFYVNNKIKNSKNCVGNNSWNISDDIADAYFLAEYSLVYYIYTNKKPIEVINGFNILNIRNKFQIVDS